jgi:prepilin-type N-terminal cleavage/methylation domain-containing protein
MNRTRGFTLIELAIVLVIITILIGGLAVPLSAQIQARRVAETRAELRAIQDALIGYAMSQTAGKPNLPCPDDGTGAAPGDQSILRDADNQCTTARGRLPWRTLGVENADAWGNLYTYAVTKKFTDSDDGFASTDPGGLDVHDDQSCTGAGVAPSVAVVIVSHGPNGRGAQNRSGGTPLAPAEVPATERANLATPTAPCTETDFVSLTPPDNDFDDLVTWITPFILVKQACSGGCPLP